MGAITIPLASLTDAMVHVSLSSVKIVTGVFVSPYNIVAVKFFPSWSMPRDLELSSALIHLVRVVECLFTAAILPIVCLVNPNRAHQFMNHRYSLENKLGRMHEKSLEKEISTLKTEKADLKNDLQTKEALLKEEIASLEKEKQLHQQFETQTNNQKTSLADLEAKVEKLDLEIQQKEKNISVIRQEKNTLNSQFEIDRNRFEGTIQDLELRLQTKENQENSLKQAKQQVENSYEQSKDEIQQLKIALSERQAKFNDKDKEAEDLKIVLQDRIAFFNQEKQQAQTDVQNLLEQIQEKDVEIKALQQDILAKGQPLSLVLRDLNAHKEISEIRIRDEQIDELQKKILNFEKNLVEKDKEIVGKTKSIKKLKGQILDVKKVQKKEQNAQQMQVLLEKETTIKDLQEENNIAKQSAKASQVAFEELKKKSDQLEQEINRLTIGDKKYSALLQKIDKINEDFSVSSTSKKDKRVIGKFVTSLKEAI